jgi:hypothetical protein
MNTIKNYLKTWHDWVFEIPTWLHFVIGWIFGTLLVQLVLHFSWVTFLLFVPFAIVWLTMLVGFVISVYQIMRGR